MKQLTKEQAVALAQSKVWQDWTDEEIVRFQLFQDRLCMNFSRFHEAVEKVLDRPVFTHEFATRFIDDLKKEYLGVKKAPTLEEIINLIPEEKRIVIGI
jgi:hypothetical protein